MSNQERIAYLKYRIDQFDQGVLKITNVLNEIHKVQHPESFWKLILQSYLNNCIQQFDQLSSVFHERRTIDHKKKGIIERGILWYKTTKQQVARKKLNGVLKNHNQLIHGFRDTTLASQDLGVILPAADFPRPNKGQVHDELREKVARASDQESNELISFMIRELPSWLVENLEFNLKSIPLHEPEKKIFHVANIRTNFTALVIAKYRLMGASLIYHQHGGVYGENEFHFSHRIQADLGDEFRTFGWKILHSDVPFTAAYRFNKFREYYHNNRRVTYDVLLGYPKVKVNNRDQIAQLTNTFFDELNKPNWKLVARPHPFKKWENQGKRLSFINDSRVKIDAGRIPIQKYVAESRIVVMFMHPTTNFLECLFVDHPIMAMLTNDNPTEIVAPFYQFFLEQGVFHHDMRSLGKKLNEVDIESWWNGITASKEYQEFKYLFARD